MADENCKKAELISDDDQRIDNNERWYLVDDEESPEGENPQDGDVRQKQINGKCLCQVFFGTTWRYIQNSVHNPVKNLRCGDPGKTIKYKNKNYYVSC